MTPAIRTEVRPVYRSAFGGKARLTAKRAYLDTAWRLWTQKHPCTCCHDPETPYTCREHASLDHYTGTDVRAEYRRKAIDRLARWLMWRDRRAEELAEATPKPKRSGENVSFLCPCKTKNENLTAAHIPECPWSDPNYQPPGGMF